MAGQDDGRIGLLVVIDQKTLQQYLRSWVQAVEWLIQNEYPGIGNQCGSNPDFLFVPLGKIPDEFFPLTQYFIVKKALKQQKLFINFGF